MSIVLRKVFLNLKFLELLVFSAIILFLTTSCSLLENASYTTFQKSVLDEINMARTNPASYAQTRLQTEQNAGTDNGAYEELTAAAAVGALTLDSKLCKAANDYAVYLAAHNVFSHTADADLATRVKRTGYSYSALGENLAAGSSASYNAESAPETAAQAFVKMLIIDAGVSSLGHRINIRSAGFTQLGAGYGYDASSAYKNYHVQDFGKPL